MYKHILLAFAFSLQSIVISSQALNPFLNHTYLAEFLNPAATNPAQINHYSLLLAHRDQLTSSQDNTGQHQFIGARIRLLPENALPYDILLSSSFYQTKTSPANFQNFQFGAAIILRPERLHLSLGFHTGYGNWTFDPANLRPWDLGDDLLLTNQNSSGQWHLGFGLFTSYQFRNGNNNLAVYLDAALPFLPLCTGNNCFEFSTDNGNAFSIKRTRSWNLNAKYLKLGVSGRVTDLSFRAGVYYFDQLTSSNYGVQVNGGVGRQRLQPTGGLTYDLPSQSFSINLGLDFVSRSNLKFGFNFSILLFGQNQYTSPSNLMLLQMARDVTPENNF